MLRGYDSSGRRWWVSDIEQCHLGWRKRQGTCERYLGVYFLFVQTSPVPIKLKPEYWSEKLQKEAEAFAYYRRTHTANERRRRGEMRDLFEKLKITLGLLHSSKVSKSLILTRVSVLYRH